MPKLISLLNLSVFHDIFSIADHFELLFYALYSYFSFSWCILKKKLLLLLNEIKAVRLYSMK